MKIKATWEEKTLSYQDAFIQYRLPNLPMFLELRTKFGQAISEDSYLGATNILIEFLVWMITDWKNIETTSDPPKPIPVSDRRKVLEFDADFRTFLMKETNLMEHLAELQTGYKAKFEDERKNLKLVATYWWKISASANGVEIHSVNIDGTLYMKDAIHTPHNNHEAFKILSMMESLKMDFVKTVEFYQQLVGETYNDDRLYDLQDKVQFVKGLWNELGSRK